MSHSVGHKLRLPLFLPPPPSLITSSTNTATFPTPSRCPHHPTSPWTMGRRSEKIKHRKGAQNLVKTRIFARAGKRIVAAARSGGVDLVSNHALADVIAQAKAVGVPRSNIERALDKVREGGDADVYKESTMEAYGKGGAGVYVELLTDNLNRAVMETRIVINKKGLKVAAPGSVGYNFKRTGVVRVESGEDEEEIGEDELLEFALELGAEDCEVDPDHEGVFRILIEPGGLSKATQDLKDKGYDIQSSQVEMIPTTRVECSAEDYDANMEAIDALQELLDVDGVYHTMTPPP